MTFEEIIDAGDQIVVVAHHEGRGRRSGVKVDTRFYEVYTVREGKVSRVDEFTERAEALKAAGLSEWGAYRGVVLRGRATRRSARRHSKRQQTSPTLRVSLVPPLLEQLLARRLAVRV